MRRHVSHYTANNQVIAVTERDCTEETGQFKGCFLVFFNWSQLGAHYFLVYIYFNFSTCFGQLCAHHQENLLYLCETRIFHCVWVAVWSVGWDRPDQARQPPIQSDLYMFRATMCPSSGELTVSMRNSYFSLCTGGCLVCWLGQTRPGQTATHTEWSLHVSGNYVSIIRRTYCIYATLVFFTLYGWLSGLLVGMSRLIPTDSYRVKNNSVA